MNSCSLCGAHFTRDTSLRRHQRESSCVINQARNVVATALLPATTAPTTAPPPGHVPHSTTTTTTAVVQAVGPALVLLDAPQLVVPFWSTPQGQVLKWVGIGVVGLFVMQWLTDMAKCGGLRGKDGGGIALAGIGGLVGLLALSKSFRTEITGWQKFIGGVGHGKA